MPKTSTKEIINKKHVCGSRLQTKLFKEKSTTEYSLHFIKKNKSFFLQKINETKKKISWNVVLNTQY